MQLQQFFSEADIYFLPNVAMKQHTTIRIGGPAEIFTIPKNIEEIRSILKIKKITKSPLFVLGGGSNIIVSDLGIPGIIMSMEKFTGMRIEDDGSCPILHCGTGVAISDAADYAAERGYSGIDFLYSMPGTVGGALWINARCYGHEISDVLLETDYLDHEGHQQTYHTKKDDFGYKLSPFQDKERIMLSCTFKMQKEDPRIIRKRMDGHRADRAKKGHFSYPSAGSVFKNDVRHGEPTGTLLDRMQMRGKSCGDAQISELHANILINKGNARASEALFLIEDAREQLFRRHKIKMELDLLLVGDWSENTMQDK